MSAVEVCDACGATEDQSVARATWFFHTSWDGDVAVVPPPEATKRYCSETCFLSAVKLPPGTTLVRKDGPEAEWFKRMQATRAADPHIEASITQRIRDEGSNVARQVRADLEDTIARARALDAGTRGRAPNGTIDLAARRNPWALPASSPRVDILKSLGLHEAEVIPFPNTGAFVETIPPGISFETSEYAKIITEVGAEIQKLILGTGVGSPLDDSQDSAREGGRESRPGSACRPAEVDEETDDAER